MPWDANLTNLKEVLADLFSSENDIRSVIRDAGLRTANMHFTGKTTTTWSNILDEADKQKTVDAIVDVALKEYPNDPYLISAKQHTLTPVKPLVNNRFAWYGANTEALEKITGKQSTLLPVAWLENGLMCAKSVAKVTLADGSYGTGFLIRDNYLLTNHHVLSSREASSTASLLFNYQKHPSGRSNKSVKSTLDPDAGFYTSEDNDWTLVRVKGNMNAQWGAIQLERVNVSVNDRASIIQHAGGAEKQVAFFHNIIAYTDATRIQYLTDTLPGSSGSPVFNDKWQLVALHHEGGHIIEPGTKRLVYRNEGIHINCVLEDIARLGI